MTRDEMKARVEAIYKKRVVLATAKRKIEARMDELNDERRNLQIALELVYCYIHGWVESPWAASNPGWCPKCADEEHRHLVTRGAPIA